MLFHAGDIQCVPRIKGWYQRGLECAQRLPIGNNQSVNLPLDQQFRKSPKIGDEYEQTHWKKDWSKRSSTPYLDQGG